MPDVPLDVSALTSKRSPPSEVSSGLPLSRTSPSCGSCASDCTVAQSLMRLSAHSSACSDENAVPAWHVIPDQQASKRGSETVTQAGGLT